MKQLLFTFFAVILCYSLFFDKGSDVAPVDEINYIYEEAVPDLYFAMDTLNSHVNILVHNKIEMWNPLFSGKKIPTPLPF
ncbi:MAG: hypothetical protein LBC19_14410 [Tannerella sp.]|nr:hypothetical protein [Tannerella sp.]